MGPLEVNIGAILVLWGPAKPQKGPGKLQKAKKRHLGDQETPGIVLRRAPRLPRRASRGPRRLGEPLMGPGEFLEGTGELLKWATIVGQESLLRVQ